METTTSETARSCAMQEPTSAFLTTGLAGESRGAPGAPLVPSDNQTNKQTSMGEHKHYIMGGNTTLHHGGNTRNTTRTQHYIMGEHKEHNTNTTLHHGGNTTHGGTQTLLTTKTLQAQ